jgi:NAD(P)H dehydrogenase (quinone)
MSFSFTRGLHKNFALALLCAAMLPATFTLAATSAATKEKFIISGASGQLGELTIKELLKRGVPAKNLILVSRTPEKLADFAQLGAVTRFGDVDEPESLPAAYKGGTRMLMISLGFGPGAAPRPARHKIAFDAAVKAGVKRIVYTSFLGADKGGNMLADDHQKSETFLVASGAKWVALRNAFYADMQLPGALQMATTGKASVQPTDPKTAPVTREDCAAAAAGALLGDASVDNKAYDITGPVLNDTRDIARMVGDIIGKPIEVTVAEARAGGPGGMPAPPPVVTDAVAKLSGRPATSLQALLEANRTQLVAAAKKK